MTTEDSKPAVGRCRTFIRMWRIVLLLHCRPHTILELADKLSVSTRTVHRDLAALRAVPLPIVGRYPTHSRKGVRVQEPQVWAWDSTAAEALSRTLTAFGEGAGRALPPFPDGPLFPPGVRP